MRGIARKAEQLAMAAMPSVGSGTILSPSLSTPQAAAATADGGVSTRPIVVHVPLNINDREFARATARVMLEEQQHLERQARRARGE